MRRIILWKGYHSEEVTRLIRESWEREDLLILYPPKLNTLKFLDCLPEGQLEFAGTWDQEIVLQVKRRNSPPIYPENPIFGIFSTGSNESTDRKLILYSKKNIESSLNAILALFDNEAYDSIFCYPQPFHTFGLILGYLHSLLYQKKLIPLNGQYQTEQHQSWLSLANAKTLTLGTPTHFKDLIKQVQQKKHSPRRTYASIVGAASVEVSLWKQLRDELNITKPSIGYGATEASPGITHLPPGQEPREDGEVGFALPHLSVELIPGKGLEFSGPSVCMARVENGQLEFPSKITLGDQLETRKDGVLVYRGRGEWILNRGGEKFNLEEIEGVLKRQLDLDAVCVSIPDARLGEELGVLVNGSTSTDP